jgi:hypothetical protein
VQGGSEASEGVMIIHSHASRMSESSRITKHSSPHLKVRTL